MTAMAPTRSNSPASQGSLPVSARRCRIPLLANLAAAAAARSVIEDAIRTWRVPADIDVAVLLTSELVTNAVTHGTPAAEAFVLLTIACDAAGLRVDVHDGSSDLPVLNAGLSSVALAETEAGRGLLLVSTLSAEWGFYRTPTGKAVYFTLGFQPDPAGVVRASDGVT